MHHAIIGFPVRRSDSQLEIVMQLEAETSRVLHSAELLLVVFLKMPKGLHVNPGKRQVEEPQDALSGNQPHQAASPQVIIADLEDAIDVCEDLCSTILSTGFHWHMNAHREIYSSAKTLRSAHRRLVAAKRLVGSITIDWWKWVAGVKELDDWDRFFFNVVDLLKKIDLFSERIRTLQNNIFMLRSSALN